MTGCVHSSGFMFLNDVVLMTMNYCTHSSMEWSYYLCGTGTIIVDQMRGWEEWYTV